MAEKFKCNQNRVGVAFSLSRYREPRASAMKTTRERKRRRFDPIAGLCPNCYIEHAKHSSEASAKFFTIRNRTMKHSNSPLARAQESVLFSKLKCSISIAVSLAAFNHCIAGDCTEPKNDLGLGKRVSPHSSTNSPSFKEASALYEQHHYDLAANKLVSLLQSDPSDTEAHKLLGNCLQQLNRLKAAKLEFDRVIAMKPDCWDVYGRRAFVERQLGQMQESVSDA